MIRLNGLGRIGQCDLDLFQKLVETRLATGEPYIVFSDTVNRMMPKHHRELGLKVSTSNLCSEITLPTGIDHLGNDRTAVCCLSSLNLEKWDEWSTEKDFVEDVMRFLDNVLQDYIERAPDEMARAKYSAERERSVGLGVSAGQASAPGTLPSVSNSRDWLRQAQRFPVIVEIDPDQAPEMDGLLRVGGQATVITYNGGGWLLKLLGKLFIRIQALLSYAY